MVLVSGFIGFSMIFILQQVDGLKDIEIIPWDNFEYDFLGNAAIIKNKIPGISILEAGTEYYVIQKAEFEKSEFWERNTNVNVTIGFGIQKGEIPTPPIGENVTDADHQAFVIQMKKLHEEIAQQSMIGNSYDFIVDVENPFYIKFPFVMEESGKYTTQFYKKTYVVEGLEDYSIGGLTVVDKFSKAVNEDSQCKNENLRPLIKHDYSTIACVDNSTASKLIDRGWGIY